MTTRMCVTINGREVCFAVPILTTPWHIGPIPEKPQPDPWITGKGIDNGLAHQAQAVATIAAAADLLADEHRDGVHQALAPVVADLERRLPGVKLGARRPGRLPSSGPGPDPA